MMRELEIAREGLEDAPGKMAEAENADHGPDEVFGESKGGTTTTSALETDEQTRPGSQRKSGRPSRESRTPVMGSRGEENVTERDGNM